MKAALLAQKQFDEMLKQTFDVVLIAGSMGGIALADFVKKTQRILKVIDGVQRLAGVTHGAAPQLGDVTVGDANVNWSAVVDQALQTLTSLHPVEPEPGGDDGGVDMTVARAREETAAMKLVGTTGEWQVGAIAGNVVHGHVHAGNNAWKATGPAVQQDASMATRTPGLSAAAGGHVRIESYAIAAITKQVEDALQAMRQGMLHDLVTFQLATIDAAGGAVAPGSSGGPAKGAPAE